LLISAIGFYELFIGEIRVGGIARMPAWLEMRDLNDLKGRVLAMIVMVLALFDSVLTVMSFRRGGSGIEDGRRRSVSLLPSAYTAAAAEARDG